MPVVGSKPLIVPSPKLPTRRRPLRSPKPTGASARPHGELSAPPGLMTRCTRVPLVSYLSTMPNPGPATSSSPPGCFLAYVTYNDPPILWMPKGAKPAGRLGSVNAPAASEGDVYPLVQTSILLPAKSVA